MAPQLADDDQPSPSETSASIPQIHTIWTRAAEFSTLAAAVIYAYGWVFLALLYRKFGLKPEEAGFGLSSLVVRLGPSVAILLLIGLGSRVALLRLAQRYPEIRLGPSPGPGGLPWITEAAEEIPIFGCLFAVAIRAVYAGTWGVGIGLVVRWLDGPGLVVGLLTAFVSVLYQIVASGRSVQTRRLSWFLSRALAVLVMVGLVALPFVAASYYSGQIRRGHSVTVPTLVPGVDLVQIYTVDLDTGGAEVPGIAAGTTCLVWLGQAEGFIVVFDKKSDATLRVPSGGTALIWVPTKHEC